MKLKLTIDGKVYEVDVEVAEAAAPQPGYVPPPGAAPAPSAAAGAAPSAAPPAGAKVDESKVCRSPISGVVVKVPAQVGQTIQANDALMMLEAMKMETVITSPVNGKIARVNAQVGDPVKTGQVLVEFE